MVSAVSFSAHLTCSDLLENIRKTQLGQAHFAGTGPVGKTCRECEHFYCKTQDGKKQHRYRSIDNKPDGPEKLVHLQSAHCNCPIPNKAHRLIPPNAECCRHFKASLTPPSETRKDQRYKQNRSKS